MTKTKNEYNEIKECLNFCHTGYCMKHSDYCLNLECEEQKEKKKLIAVCKLSFLGF